MRSEEDRRREDACSLRGESSAELASRPAVLFRFKHCSSGFLAICNRMNVLSGNLPENAGSIFRSAYV